MRTQGGVHVVGERFQRRIGQRAADAVKAKTHNRGELISKVLSPESFLTMRNTMREIVRGKTDNVNLCPRRGSQVGEQLEFLGNDKTGFQFEQFEFYRRVITLQVRVGHAL